jgi:hypothetical protein
MPTVPCSPRPRPPSASACPASTRPASDVRCVSTSACPVSARLVSDTPVSVSGLQSPVSDVGCPVSGASVRHPVRVASVSALSAPVSSWSARVRRAATHVSDRRGRRLTPPYSRPARRRPSQSLVLGVGRAGSGGIGWTPAAVVERSGGGQARPLGRQGHAGCAQDRPSAEQPVRGGSPTGTGCVQVGRSVLSAWCRPRPESLGRGSSALGGRLADSASVRGPTAAQGGGRSLNSSPAGRGNPV